MAKANIELLQLEESFSGIWINPWSNHPELERIKTKIHAPHRHDHYVCFFIESGELNFSVDFQPVEIRRPSLLISSPGQVHKLGYAKDITGWGLAFNASFIDQDSRMIIENSFTKVALLNLGDTEKKWFSGILQLIYSSVHEEKEAHFAQALIQTLLNSFFYKSAAIFQTQEDVRSRNYSTRSIEITRQFRQLVKEHFPKLKKPADYASKMALTVSYLNDTVKSTTGFHATWLIQQEIFREAQRLLFYTDKSVKEVAFQLGYDDYKYFIRMFGKITGMSPASFRKSSKS
ncbi:AraC family transcriptional regulator [Dyadobacter sp. 32]|uniref:AraC family transcriptional regulator n=1 Tax=Dyadobacter sp. 32 TaxID=538966 RepID=UPI0039C62A08